MVMVFERGPDSVVWSGAALHELYFYTFENANL